MHLEVSLKVLTLKSGKCKRRDFHCKVLLLELRFLSDYENGMALETNLENQDPSRGFKFHLVGIKNACL